MVFYKNYLLCNIFLLLFFPIPILINNKLIVRRVISVIFISCLCLEIITYLFAEYLIKSDKSNIN